MAETPASSAPDAGPEARADTDYERADLPLRPILIAGLVLTLLLGLAPLISLRFFPSTAGDVERGLSRAPPEPRLQTQPRQDLAAQLAHQHALLNSYGWIDRSAGIAHVPISIAMKRAADQGIEGFPRAPPEAHSP